MDHKVKTLFLMRHGKSAWDQPELDDIKRTLLPKGEQRTEQIAHYLKEINIKIDKVISSPAVRAHSTAKIIKNLLHLPEIEVDNRLYPCYEDEIFNRIIGEDDDINNILIVGHNPGLTYFAQEYMNAEIDNLPTSGIISCRFYTNSWSEFSLSDHKLNFIVFPKNLK